MSDERPTHLDIFSGIGGFALAAQWAEFRTIAFCESDSRCREFLAKRWGLPVEPDIRKLDGRRYAGVSLLTGGPPCQPASRAGKQGGAADDRWLWLEALRVLDEAKPDSFVFENPLGIGDLAKFGIFPPVGGDGFALGNIGDTFDRRGTGVFDEILGDIEKIGYEAQPFDIPACAVDSPQLRHRYWIVGFLADASRRRSGLSQREAGRATGANETDVADRNGERCESWVCPESEGSTRRIITGRAGIENNVADTERERRKRRGAVTGQEESGEPFGSATGLHWSNSIWVPCADGKLRRAPDDSFDLVDGLHRSLLGALGNAIVPQEAYEILQIIRPLLNEA